jgi:hypothetical protein
MVIIEIVGATYRNFFVIGTIKQETRIVIDLQVKVRLKSESNISRKNSLYSIS